MKKFWKWLWDRPVLLCVVLAVFLNISMEMLGRRSVWAGLQFLVLHPVYFLCNILIVLLTLFLSLLVKRRIFMLSLVSTVWIGLAIANFVLLGYRTTPLSAIDFYILKPAFSILKIYLTPVQMVLIPLAFFAAIAGMILVFFKVPKHQALYRSAILSMAVTSAAVLGLIHFFIQADSAADFTNLTNAYHNYGFAYCFAASLLDTGIDKPEDYSVETMASLAEDIEAETKEDVSPDAQKDSAIFADSQQEPNIVMVQLESFIDPNRLDGFTYSENPVPFFTWLKERYTSGYLSVPSIGGGTANTEFEVLTGMSLDYFGPGEYPYKTILQQSTCESIAYNLKELGFGTHVIHNNTGTFYDRHLVFPNLGFDTFTSLEYMNHVEKNPLGWAKDTVLTTEILTTLFSTEQRDFIYAISVQPHGKYPSVPLGDEQPITVSSTVLSEDELIPFSYYVNQVYEEDAFLRSLVQALETCAEPTILVLYGDHLPSISAAEDYMAKGDLLQTEYVIWDNIGLEEQDLDLEAYQLSASILKKLGIQSGFLNSFHQSFAETPRYQEYLELLEYDMLYGEKAVYGGSDGYRPTDMQMGIKPIALEQYRMLGSTLYVFGSEFTPYSRICINGDPADTVFISSGAIKADDLSLEEEDQITVAQVGEDGIFLSETDSLSFSKNTAP